MESKREWFTIFRRSISHLVLGGKENLYTLFIILCKHHDELLNQGSYFRRYSIKISSVLSKSESDTLVRIYIINIWTNSYFIQLNI